MMAIRKECTCGHGKCCHSFKSVKKNGKVVKVDGKIKISPIGKCKVPSCNCKEYKFRGK